MMGPWELWGGWMLARPWALWIGAAMLALIVGALRSRARRTVGSKGWASHVDAALLPHVCVGQAGERFSARRQRWLQGVIGALLIVAWAGPVRPGSAGGEAVRLVLVAQGGTAAVAPDVLMPIIEALPPGPVGLMVYAGDAYLLVPPTRDRATLRHWANQLSPQVMPVPGDDPNRALAEAAATAARLDTPFAGVLVIAADGAAAPSGEAPGGMRVDFLQIPSSSAPSEAWRGVVQHQGGAFHEFREGAVSPGWSVERDQRSSLDLGPSLVLLALFIWLGGVVWHVQPGSSLRAGARSTMSGLFGLMVAFSGLLGSGGVWAQDDAPAEDLRWSAVAQYRAGNFAAAAELWGMLGEAYNQGNALAQAGQLREALAAYELALAADLQHEDAKHNRDLVARLLQSPPPPKNRPPPSSQKPSGSPPPPQKDPASEEADRIAEAWLRRVGGTPPPEVQKSLIERLLASEAARRAALSREPPR